MTQGTTPTLPELLKLAVSQRLESLHVSFPARVLSYDSATQLANVQPCVRMASTELEGESVKLPPLLGCPVLWPAGSGASMHLGLSPGDDVTAVIASHELEAWLQSGGADVEPTTRRRHNLSDSYVYPGGRPKTRPLASPANGGASFGLDDGSCELRIQLSEAVLTGPIVKLGSAAASKPGAFGDVNDANWTALVTWAGLVNGALAALGAPIAPLATISATVTAKTKVE